MQQLGCCAGSNPLSAIPSLGELGQVSLAPCDSIYLLDRNSSISQTEKSISANTSLKVCEAHRYICNGGHKPHQYMDHSP